MMRIRRHLIACGLAAAVLGPAAQASAQLDPLLPIKRTKPNILLAVDTANRMQRDADGDYRDANVYRRLGEAAAPWEVALGVGDANTVTHYRRKYVALTHTDPVASAGDKFEAAEIQIVGDLEPGFADFDRQTRIDLARRSLAEAVARNSAVVRFSLLRTRQQAPRFVTPATPGADSWAINEGPVKIVGGSAAAAAQKLTGDSGVGKWKITRPVVDSINGSLGGPVAPLVAADDANANAQVASILSLPTGAAGSLLPAGRDAKNTVDAPLDNMLDDLKAEAARLIAADANCGNTVAILVVGGGEGTTTAEDPVAKAAQFLNISGRRVPVYVVAIAPLTAAERTQLQGIAAATGGVYTEITAAMAGAGLPGAPVPELVRAINHAVSNAFMAPGDFNQAPTAAQPFGLSTEHQVTSPVVGTVNLEGALDIDGNVLPNTVIPHAVTGETIPQRSNLMVTAGYALPGFDGKLRGFRVHKPEVDTTRPLGWKFVQDGTRLWVGAAPPAASRNIYTALPNGSVVAFTAANAATLQAYLKASSVAEAQALIEYVRAQPLGAILGSTPAIMDPPSLDPPPDPDYPQFADAHKNRRSLVWVGANDGMLHALDARLGREVWAFIPFNLLPKLGALRSGQPVGDFRYFVDASPKVADVKVNGAWRTYLVVGEGAGGTFYQTFDVTLDNLGAVAPPASDNLNDVLSYFSAPESVPLKWSFPSYADFDVSIGAFGDIAAAAPPIAKTVGQTWSDPAVGQIESFAGRFTVLTGSGFFPWSRQQQPHRNGVVAGTTFYVLDARDGAVLDSRDVGHDGKAETVDDCAAVNDCRQLKNALTADPVATGPPDSRFITKVYLGDLDGKMWRFDLGLNAAGVPTVKQLVSLYTVDNTVGPANEHPLFASMATVNVGATQQYLFAGTGSDLLPQNGVNAQYALLVILDQGATGSRTASIKLERTDGVGGDEKVTAFPAVAGDIVFFSTTTTRAGGCTLPDANLYAFTFIGGPAYDTTGDQRVTTADSTRVRTTAGVRATSPFIVDQHLVFGAGKTIEMFGDPEDFNNGVGQAGVRILSWREVR